MKKIFFMTMIFGAALTTTVNAQTSGVQAAGTQTANEQAAMLQAQKDKICPKMVEKTGLTREQADKVVELNFEMRMGMAGLQNLSEEDRKAKVGELKAAKEKKFAEFLSADQIKAVYAFYQEMGKDMQKKPS